MTDFDLILHFFPLEHTAVRLRAKFEVSSFNLSRDIRVSQKSKSGLREPHMTPFDLILHFFVSTHCHPFSADFTNNLQKLRNVEHRM